MENNYFKNLKLLKKCRKIYNIIFWVYAVSCLVPAGITFIYGILSLASISDNITGFLATIILLLALFGTGLLSIYRKDIKFIYIPIPVAFLLMILNNFNDMFFLNVITFYSIGNIHIIIAIISSAILTIINKNYHYLEQQEGFPYFNERFEENKNKLSEYKNNNPYQHYLDRYKDSSGKMEDI